MTVTVDQIVARKSSRRRRVWLWLALVVALGAGAWYWQSRTAATALPSFATVKAAPADITVTVTAVGTVEPIETVAVAAQVTGVITALPAAANAEVKAGDPLASIDTSTLEATVARDRAALAVQEAALAEAQATRDEAASALDRARKMADRGIATQEALSGAEAAAKRAEAGLAAARAQKAVAEADLQLAQANLAKACICAPIDGVVLTSTAVLGQPVTASGSTLFTLAPDLTQMELKLDVDEADVGRVHVGDAARFTVEAYDNRTFSARVTQIAYASHKVDDVVTYETTLSLDNTEGLLRPGMTAAADITVAEAKGVLAVPNAAFRYAPPATGGTQRGSGLLGMLIRRPASQAGGGASARAEDGTRPLYVLRDGQAVEVRVKTGVTDGALTQILSGDLAEGDLVITGSGTGQ
jgi:HlyD family secretion protein